jgi:hypothetical protein
MTRADKLLYHQLHPLKLLTDFATSFLSTWLAWEGRFAAAAGWAFLPSIAVTVALVLLVDLEPYKRSVLGHYVGSFMTRRIEALRLLGQVVMWLGAALHVPWSIPLGFLVIVYGWLRGLWLQPAASSPAAPRS